MFKFFLFFIPIFGIGHSQYVYDPLDPPDYCINQADSCKYQGKVHFACNRSEDFAPTCSADRDVVPMTLARIETILGFHNSLRSQVALGLLSDGLNGATFPPASRMPTVKWSQELADLALLNVKQCKMQHDACHNTAEFKFSGQNLGSSSSNINYKDPDVVISGLTNAWFQEYKAANATNIANCCFSYTGADIGHFLTFVTDKSTHIGCAMTKYIKDVFWKTYLFSCNYASASISGYNLYKAGTTASGCLSGTNPEYPGLCSENETIDPNKF